MRKVLIIGATSAIAHETARHFALERARLFLVARNPERLAAVAEDLKVYGAEQVETFLLDMNEMERHAELLQRAMGAMGGLDVLFVAHGTLPDQAACEGSVEQTMAEFSTNALSVISLLTLAANQFERQKRGCIAVISSVAGDRGRQTNYVYGAAKAAVSTFLSGLRGRLFKSGVPVVDIRPGFVDTPMTAHLPKNALFASPEKVGKRIYQAIIKGKDVVYVPWFWFLILTVIKLIPEPIFKRLKI